MTRSIIPLPSSMPDPLAGEVRKLILLAEPSEGYGLPQPLWHPDAETWLTQRQKHLAPGNREQCHTWLLTLATGYNGLTEAAVTLREVMVWAASQKLPATVWCEETLGKVVQKHPRYFPQAGEIFEILQAHAKPLQDEIAALERIVKAPRPDPRIAVEAPPRIVTSTPDWVGKGRIDDGDDVPPHPPVRTVEEQIKALTESREPVKQGAA